MIVTTTPTVEGRPVKDYLGIVTGEAVMTGTLDDLGAALANLGKGRGYVSERRLFEAHQIAVRKMCDRAKEMGASAVVGVHFDHETGPAGTMVIASGTAVVIP